MMAQIESLEFSGAAKVWDDFATLFADVDDDESVDSEEASSDEFRDEYIRLPYDEGPQPQQCRW